jgi:hypothetical protein
MDQESTVNQQAMKGKNQQKSGRQFGEVYKKIQDTISSLNSCTHSVHHVRRYCQLRPQQKWWQQPTR